MRYNIKTLGWILWLALLATGCEKHEELDFSGTMIGVRQCSAALTDMNVGYIVQLEKPAGLGGKIVSSSGDTLYNLVVLFESPRVVQAPTHMHGKFYLDDKYSRVNGCARYDNEDLNNLPEGVFTQLVVD